MFVLDKIGVVKLFPEAILVPPDTTSYQSIDPIEAVAFNVIEPASHLDAAVIVNIFAMVKVVLAEILIESTSPGTTPPYSTIYPFD